ncbi:MAG TPA: DUF3488 and transglutaminase-like domain-containing protein [Burkholderiaceae bacterium]|nr:DUF3488 and transglutaminase-like domain-containing protein [Burkholderiaceae bacterium]
MLSAATLRQRLTHLPREDRDTLFLLGVVALVIAPHVPYLPVWCTLLSGAILLWRGVLAWRSRPLPSRAWVLALLVLGIGATWLSYRTIVGREAGVTLIVLLLSLKMLELRARRDAFVVFFLAFFTLLTQFFRSQSMLVAVAMIAALWALLTALVNAHRPVGRPALWDSARIAGRLALWGTPVMVLLFALFPRLAPLWGMPSDPNTGRSGLSAEMRVGSVAQLALDDSIALRIQFSAPPPPQHRIYLRGPVLGRFDGQEWTVASPGFARGAGGDLRVQGAPLSYEVTLEPAFRPWVLVLDATPDAPQLPGMSVAMTPDLQWIASRPLGDLTRYRAVSYLDFGYGALEANRQVATYTQLPPGFNPRTLELARQMRADPQLAEAGAARLSAAVLERLRTGGYGYTLEPGLYGENSADEFWFDRKLGFCEHIASAYVILMRALGVPARVVTGYQGGSLNTMDGFWTVRQSDAHAWAEIWEPGQGWRRVDPTEAVAPARIGTPRRLAAPQGVVAGAFTAALSPTVLAQLRAGWEALNNRWNQWILTYNQGRQFELLKNIGFETPSWEDLVRLIAYAIVAAGLRGALWTLLERRRRDPWLALLARARRRLTGAGLDTLAPSATPRQIAAAARARWGDAAAPLAAWLLALERWRYADADTARPPLAALERQFASLAWPAT